MKNDRLLIKLLFACLTLTGAGNIAAQTTNYNGVLDFTGTTVPVSFAGPFGTINGNAGIDLQRFDLGNSLSGTGVGVSLTTHNAFNPQGTVLALIFATDPNNAIFNNPSSLASLINPSISTTTFLNNNVVGWEYFAYATAIASNGTTDISSLFAPMSFTAGTNYYAFLAGGSAISGGVLADSSVAYTLSINTTPVPVPAAVWLLGSGLVGLFGMQRRRKASSV